MPAEKSDVRKTPPPRRSSWENIKVIYHPETLLAARINRLDVRPHPEYTFELGRVDEVDEDDDEGVPQFHRFLKPKVTIVKGEVELEVISEEGMAWVMTEAGAFIAGEIQKREHELELQRKTGAPKKKKVEGRRPST